MMKKFVHIVLMAMILALGHPVFGAESIGPKKAQRNNLRTTANCLPSSASAQLDINNVRCLLHNGGDMWWDLTNNPRYEVPKVSNPALAKHSAFASSLWIGGIDDDNNLRVAAQTYRQSGNDFFPGPLTETGAVTEAVCNDWDKMYKIDKSEILAFRAAFAQAQATGDPLNMNAFPAVASWPAFGENADGRIPMAPFVDVDGNSMDYDPAGGDYPDIRPIEGGGEPDQAIWWVINDKGDIHTATGGQAIGLEIQMMAFAFSTSNAINDMTFYKYKVINKSSSQLKETYMGLWSDVDLGNPADDYVGCDVERGFAYAYNGDAVDETASGYGEHPPTFGTDFFQGPKGDNDSLLGMQKFVYYTNNTSLTGEPDVATHYYGYLRGFWKDGSRMTYGGNGFHGGIETDYMFPGDPGACGVGSGWSELGEGNPPGDRRYLMSAGPFTLGQGAQNNIITGAVWARSDQNAQLGSLCELFAADDLAQALFDAQFQLLDGPDAPQLAVEEFDRSLVLNWDYDDANLFNNYNESYAQIDPALASQHVSDPEFEFQGYMVFQLRDETVSASELFDSERARLLTQCDIQDGVGTIMNRTLANVPGLSEPIVTDMVMVEGADQGIFHSFEATEDLFAEGADRKLVNYRTYHYGVLAYAYNSIPSDGRRFVQGNRFFKNVSALPHKVDFEAYGTLLGSIFGEGIPMYQVAGFGNGGNAVELQPETVTFILQNGSASRIGYLAGKSPVRLRVINPKEIKKGNYRLDVVRDLPSGAIDTVEGLAGLVIEQPMAEWVLYYEGNEIYRSTYIRRIDSSGAFVYRPAPLSGVERIVAGHGLAIAVNNPIDAADTTDFYDPVLAASVTYANPKAQWLGGYGDSDEADMANWIMAGRDTFDRGARVRVVREAAIYDPNENFEKVLNGAWAPMCLARSFVANNPSNYVAPGISVGLGALALNMPADSMLNLRQLQDVDIVITKDPSKWSRCVVVETCLDKTAGSGAHPLAAKWETGLNQDLSPMGGAKSIANQGWSMFPGYAIDVNTGQRLNIFFGENSWDKLNNGGDLLFNPTSDYGQAGQAAGGRHYVYVSKTPYDGCEKIHELLAHGNLTANGTQIVLNPSLSPSVWNNPTNIGRVYRDISWVGIPMSLPDYEWKTYDQIPSDLRISLRVNQPFRSRVGTSDIPIFEFNTDALAAQMGVVTEAKRSLLADVRVVPNPYYAFSKYEQAQLQTIVKVTNLPQKCKISIFNLSGTKIRTYNKESASPEQIWDLKNHAGVPIAGGVYIVHVDGFELGEAILKLMVIMPQIDLNAY